MTKVAVIFGTRPEAIKMAPLILELQKFPQDFQVYVCATGQHRDMVTQVYQVFDITPTHELNVMTPNQTLTGLTARLLQGLEDFLLDINPDFVLVHGDTSSALAGALAAYYQKIPVGHIESGLRTYNRYEPFPEETNRRLIDTLSTYHFAPTRSAADHLRDEKVSDRHIYTTGNTVIDALHAIHQKPCELSIDVNWGSSRVILVTAHRRESFGQPIVQICRALRCIVERHPHVEIVFPVHLNPKVREPVHRLLSQVERIHLLDPLNYVEFTHLMARSYLVLTDSGGIQEEAPSLGVPVLVMRNETERPEAVEANTVKVVGTDTDTIVRSVEQLFEPDTHRTMAQAINPYGDGKASHRIVQALRHISAS